MAYALWQVMFREAAKGLVLSQGEAEAWDMITKAKFIHEHLPEWMQFPLKHPDNRSLMDFISNGYSLSFSQGRLWVMLYP